MFSRSPADSRPEVTGQRALRHLLVFQVKLAMDALRDFALSPLSIIVFVIDAVRKPKIEDSLYLRLMGAGRQSDRIINLFDEYSDAGHYTVDETLAEVEEVVSREMAKKKLTDDGDGPRS
jgi:hypothetical protein